MFLERWFVNITKEIDAGICVLAAKVVATSGAPEEVRLQVFKGAERRGTLKKLEELVDTCMSDNDEKGWTGDWWLPPLNKMHDLKAVE
jgi:aromatic ring hydroxylase